MKNSPAGKRGKWCALFALPILPLGALLTLSLRYKPNTAAVPASPKAITVSESIPASQKGLAYQVACVRWPSRGRSMNEFSRMIENSTWQGPGKKPLEDALAKQFPGQRFRIEVRSFPVEIGGGGVLRWETLKGYEPSNSTNVVFRFFLWDELRLSFDARQDKLWARYAQESEEVYFMSDGSSKRVATSSPSDSGELAYRIDKSVCLQTGYLLDANVVIIATLYRVKT